MLRCTATPSAHDVPAAPVILTDTPAWSALPAELQTLGSELLSSRSVVVLPRVGQPRLVLAKAPQWTDAVAVRRRGGAIAMAAQADGITALDLAGISGPATAVEPFLAGLAHGAYTDDRHRAKIPPRLGMLHLPGAGSVFLRQFQALCDATAWCRDAVNAPANLLGPEEFVAETRRLVRGTGLRVRLLDEDACRAAGMELLRAVGNGSPRRPRLLVLEWPGAGATARRSRAGAGFLALLGKGICFDTGGVQVKPGASMELMRKDMGGAATVVAALAIAALCGCPRAVRAYLPLAENSLGGAAYRPGDIYRAYDGTTVEIGHTDAEGRLVLADAMGLAVAEGATSLVTVATLTGAALTALGRIHVPLMASDDGLASALLDAAAAVGEKLWRLPLDADHQALVRGKVATLTNGGNGEAGCIAAGAFLWHFAAGKPFAHCDISPASWQNASHDLGPAGATGILVHALARFLCRP